MSSIKQKITTFLWYDNQALEAAQFYCSLFKNSKIIQSTPLLVTFQLDGQQFMALNGGPQFKFTEAVSLYIDCESQQEVDEFWDKLSKDAMTSVCGWVKDKYGLWWQVVPTLLGKLISDPDKEKSQDRK